MTSAGVNGANQIPVRVPDLAEKPAEWGMKLEARFDYASVR